MRQTKFSPLAALIVAFVIATMAVGCGDNPLEGPTGPNGGVHDTITVITPPDTTHHPCPTCPPDTCTTCPPDTVPTPPPGSQSYSTPSGRIHEAQSHATLATVTITSQAQVCRLSIPIEYESGKSQQNEKFHVYFRDVNNFANKWDMIFPPTGTQVVPDPSGFDGTLVRRLTITNLPSGTYEVVIQQDLPNHHSPGESDIRFGSGTLTVSPQ